MSTSTVDVAFLAESSGGALQKEGLLDQLLLVHLYDELVIDFISGGGFDA